MTQIASLDLGAIAANRQAGASSKGAAKGHNDFMAAYRHASNETRKTERPQDADRATEARQERSQDADAADETRAQQAQAPEKPQPQEHTAHADQAADVQAPQARTQDDQAAKADDQAQAQQAQAADAQAAQQAQTATTDAADQAAADAQAAEAVLDAQAVLALQLATGGQVQTPAPQAPTATDAQAQASAQANAPATTGVDQAADGLAAAQALLQTVDPNAPTDPKLDQAIQQALRQATADAQAAKPQAQAQATAAQAAKTPVDAAAQAGLNVTEVKVQPKPMNPNAPAFANTAQAQPEKVSNLMLELLDRKPVEVITQGSTTPATTLDEAVSLETNANAVTLLEGDTAEAALPDASDAVPQTPQLNGDRTAVEVKAVPVADKPQTPVRPEDVMPQLLKHAEQMKAAQANTIKLQLYPEHLGKMEIKVMAHQGVLSAQISADSQAVKGMLETQVAQLQRTFADLGLKVDKVEVALSSANLGNESSFGGQAMGQGDAQQFGQQAQHGGRSLSRSGYGQWLGDEPADEATLAGLESTTAVDYVA